MDCIETSRGCNMVCSFCSITNMYGKSFRPYPIERVIKDLKAVKSLKTETVLITDDNITLDVPHFKKICQKIIKNKLNAMEYIV